MADFFRKLNEGLNIQHDQEFRSGTPRVNEDDDEPAECPMCGGPGVPLGQLGNRMHYKCENCGMDFSRDFREKRESRMMEGIHVGSQGLEKSALPAEAIKDCSASGRVDDAVEYWRKKLGFTVDRKLAIQDLQEYGAWEKEELEALSDDDLAEKILWLACGNFKDGEDFFHLGV